jgi:hypothetical protein
LECLQTATPNLWRVQSVVDSNAVNEYYQTDATVVAAFAGRLLMKRIDGGRRLRTMCTNTQSNTRSAW